MKKYIVSLVFLLTAAAAMAQSADSTAVTPPVADSTFIKERNLWGKIGDWTVGIWKSATAGVEYRVKAGISLGGALPMPIPLEIREVKGFNPLLNLSIEGEIMKNFNAHWALSFGLRFEQKGMQTDARVQSYQMEMVADDGGKVSGMWTGMVTTRMSNSYLTLPVLAVWRISPRWGLKLGMYGSYMTSGSFSGAAYDGYLREGSPIGEKIELGDEKAGYNFSDDLRHWLYGVQLGGEWRAFSHLIVGIDATCGLNSIFKKDFNTISFDMFPMYGNLNFGYAF